MAKKRYGHMSWYYNTWREARVRPASGAPRRGGPTEVAVLHHDHLMVGETLRRKLAKTHEVNRATLKSIATDPTHQPIWEFNRTTKGKLPVAVEDDYVWFLQEMNDRGLGRDKDQIREDVNELIAALPEHEQKGFVTDSWVKRFLGRRRDDLKTYWTSPLAAERAQALNPTNVKLFFELVHEHVVVPELPPECIWGMDETNSQDVQTVKKKVVGRARMKQVHKQGGGNKESTTVIAAIGANGTALPPTVIFKGKGIQRSWVKNNVSNAAVAASENGWIDSEIGYQWLTKDFDPATRELAAGRPRVLFLDGHSSHWTVKFLRAAAERQIYCVGYPPHSTHALQGLDVVAFGHLKTMLAAACAELAEQGIKLSKENFLEVFGNVWLKAMNPDLCRAAFEKTGIVPYNPDVITAAQMKPSAATSTTENCATQIPSPIKAIMDALDWGLPDLTTADLDLDSDNDLLLPSTPTRANTELPPARTLQPDLQRIHAIDPALLPSPTRTPVSSPEPQSSRRRRRSHSTADTSDDSPRKRVRLLASNLSKTRASFLISKKPGHSSERLASPLHEAVRPEPLPEPDWSLLKYRARTTEELMDLPNETSAQLLHNSLSELELAKAHVAAANKALLKANSTIVLQRLENKRMRKALSIKEKKKEGKRLTKRGLICPKGRPMHMTAPEIIKGLEVIEAETEGEKRAVQQRKKDNAERQVVRDKEEQYWKDVKAQVGREQAKWETKLARLREEGNSLIGAKNILGKKPAMPLKADVLAEFTSGNRRPLATRSPAAEEADDDEEEEWSGFGWKGGEEEGDARSDSDDEFGGYGFSADEEEEEDDEE
ncbi:DDE-domain-containing protein [Peniophora sp. CONT]|nr:DDE-domain-containing protein [Peniophora sp. CONT]